VGVLARIDVWVDKARDTCPPAAAQMDALRRAWVARWGSERPRVAV